MIFFKIIVVSIIRKKCVFVISSIIYLLSIVPSFVYSLPIICGMSYMSMGYYMCMYSTERDIIIS